MRKLTLAIGLAIATLGGAAMAQSDPVLGTWQTQPDEGAFAHVDIVPCGAAVCGTIVRSYDAGGNPIQSPNIGRQIVIDMVPQGDGVYQGSVWRPSNDKVYVGSMTLEGANNMTLRGCVLGGLICSGQSWVRVP